MTSITDPRALAAFRKPSGVAFQSGARRVRDLRPVVVLLIASSAFAVGVLTTLLTLAARLGK